MGVHRNFSIEGATHFLGFPGRRGRGKEHKKDWKQLKLRKDPLFEQSASVHLLVDAQVTRFSRPKGSLINDVTHKFGTFICPIVKCHNIGEVGWCHANPWILVALPMW